MSNWFVDPIGGNDSHAGNSYATRWQTITTGATLARLTSGDTVLVMESPAATNMGQNAVFTYNDNTLTLTTAVTANIDLCESAWTASTNVTCSTSTDRRQGSFSSEIAIGSSFTTGKAAYDTCATANLSAYQQISFMIKSSVDISAGSIKLALCSDGAGATIVDSVTINEYLAAGAWTAITINTGSALGSSILTVALYVVTSLGGAATIQLDNILACKAVSAVDSLTLNSLVSKNDGIDGWHGVESIDNTSVILATDPQTGTPGQAKGYHHATATVNIWKRECFTTPLLDAGSFNGVGIPLNQAAVVNQDGITYSGGWDSTSMTSQVGESFFDGRNGNGAGIYNGMSGTNMNNLGFFRYYFGVAGDTGSSGFVINEMFAGCCHNDGITYQSGGSGNAVSNISSIGNNNSGLSLWGGGNPDFYTLSGNFDVGRSQTQSGIFITNNNNLPYVYHSSGTITANLNDVYGIAGGAESRAWDQIVVQDNGSAGFDAGSFCWNTCEINSLTGSKNGIGQPATIQNGLPILKIKQFDATNDAAAYDINGFSTGDCDICIFNAVGLPSTPVINFVAGSEEKVKFQNVGGNPYDNRTYAAGWSIFEQTSIIDSGSPTAWQIADLQSWVVQTFPAFLSISKQAVKGIGTYTLTARIYRTSTNIHCRLRIPGGRVSGVPNDTIVSADNTPGQFNTATITANPNAAGVVECFLDVWGSVSDSVYVTNSLGIETA